jgi:pimeloyl-ACP methyl ester carboxylesterase
VATVVDALCTELGLAEVTLVGHDIGGMVAFAHLCERPGLAAAVIMDTAVPGLAPWDEVARNPFIWHFAFHAVPELPERLVQGQQARAAYSSGTALAAGDLYPRLPADAGESAGRGPGPLVDVPLLYLRGEHEGGDLEAYARGFRAADVNHVTTDRVPSAGQFGPEEAPADVWRLVRRFRRDVGFT